MSQRETASFPIKNGLALRSDEINLLAAQPKSFRDPPAPAAQTHLIGFIGANLVLGALFFWLCPIAQRWLHDATAARYLLGILCLIAGAWLMGLAAQRIGRHN